MELVNKWTYDNKAKEVVLYEENENGLKVIGIIKNFTQRMYDNLPKDDTECLIELLKLYITQHNVVEVNGRITLNDGTTVQYTFAGKTLTFIDNLKNTINVIDCENEQQLNELVEQLTKVDKYDFMDFIYQNSDYDFGNDYKTIMETYFEDIIIGNGEDAVCDEIKYIKQDLQTMNEETFCKVYGISKLDNMYFKK